MILALHFLVWILIGIDAHSATDPIFAEQNKTAKPTSIKMVFGVLRPPYIFEKKNKGLDFEITKTVVETMGLQLVAMHSPNRRGWSELERKKADAIVGVTPDDSIKNLHFSEPILVYDNVAISKKEKNLTIDQIADLKKIRFLAFSEANRYLGPEYQTVVSELKRATDIPDQRKQNILFWSDKVDVIILDVNVFRFYQRELSSRFKTSEPVVIHRLFPMKANWRSVAFHDKDLRDKFNRALATIRADGRYQAILDRYLKMELLEPADPSTDPKSP